MTMANFLVLSLPAPLLLLTSDIRCSVDEQSVNFAGFEIFPGVTFLSNFFQTAVILLCIQMYSISVPDK